MDKTKVAQGLGLTAAVGAGVAAGLFGAEQADAHENRVIVGMRVPTVAITSGWNHSAFGSNLDLDLPSGGSEGTVVAWRSKHYSGDHGMKVTTVQYGGSCTGVQMDVQDEVTGQQLGDYWYVHINPSVGVGTSWKTSTSPGAWTERDVGTVLSEEVCTAWSAPHLHQGADNAEETAVFTNWALDDSSTISPVTDADNNWMHKYSW